MADVAMFENRLRKNLARLGPWARREQIDAFRLYDRDIPEFPWLVDLYADRALLTEYVTPRGRRLSDIERERVENEAAQAVCRVAGIAPARLHRSRRERHLSLERQSAGRAVHEFAVREHGLSFRVNLDDYLDTGLFLDHRPARRRIAQQARGRRLLNLFCYTGAFSVHAAAAGAASTTSVDLSSTYLAWAGRNLEANGLARPEHRLVRADVFDFLEQAREEWDLIVLDPPTLSRSTGGKSFDVQKAHPRLIELALQRLTRSGLLFFSTNARTFRLSEDRLPPCTVREVTAETTPPDFREGLHRAFEISKLP